MLHIGELLRLLADFSIETLLPRREWHDILKVLKGKKLTTKNTLPYKGIQNARKGKEFSRQAKSKGVHHH